MALPRTSCTLQQRAPHLYMPSSFTMQQSNSLYTLRNCMSGFIHVAFWEPASHETRFVPLISKTSLLLR